MEKYNLEELKEEASRYTLTSDFLNDFLDNLKKSIIANSNLLMDANKEDVKVNKKQIKIKKLLEVVDKYRDSDCVLNGDERKIVIYKGDPYVTLHICLQAITGRIKIALLHEDFMVGVNKVLIAIVKNMLKEMNIVNLIDEISHYSMNDVDNLKTIYDEMIVIGDTAIYQLLKENNKNVKFFSYNNIAIYCESNELIKLQEAIYIYANENQYEIEIIYSDSVKNAIEIINADNFKNMAILLTKSNENKEMFEKNIQNKDVYVNDNPFKEELGRIYNYLG